MTTGPVSTPRNNDSNTLYVLSCPYASSLTGIEAAECQLLVAIFAGPCTRPQEV